MSWSVACAGDVPFVKEELNKQFANSLIYLKTSNPVEHNQCAKAQEAVNLVLSSYVGEVLLSASACGSMSKDDVNAVYWFSISINPHNL